MKKSVLIVLCLSFIEPAEAYIDPATGSMIFSVFIGIITTLYFLLQILWHKITFLIGADKLKNDNFPIVIYNEGKKYAPDFLPILDEFEKRQYDITFYTSSIDDPCFQKGYKYVHPEYIGQGNKAYFKLAFLRADVCLMTTPGLDIFQLKKSKFVRHYSFMPHGIGDMCGYRLFSLDYFNSLLIVSDINEKYVREIEEKRNLPKKEIKTIGCTRLDFMEDKIKNRKDIKNDKFTVLFSPSWGVNSLIQRFGDKILSKLALQKDWEIIVRLHPQSYISEKNTVKTLMEKYSNLPNFYFDTNTDNIPSMAKADVMISDFSGIIHEFVFLFEKPVIYSIEGYNADIYDACFLDDTTWRFKTLNLIGEEIKEENVDNLISIIQNLKDNKKQNQIREVKDLCWKFKGTAAINAVDFLISKQKELAGKK